MTVIGQFLCQLGIHAMRARHTDGLFGYWRVCRRTGCAFAECLPERRAA